MVLKEEKEEKSIVRKVLISFIMALQHLLQQAWAPLSFDHPAAAGVK